MEKWLIELLFELKYDSEKALKNTQNYYRYNYWFGRCTIVQEILRELKNHKHIK